MNDSIEILDNIAYKLINDLGVTHAEIRVIITALEDAYDLGHEHGFDGGYSACELDKKMGE